MASMSWKLRLESPGTSCLRNTGGPTPTSHVATGAPHYCAHVLSPKCTGYTGTQVVGVLALAVDAMSGCAASTAVVPPSCYSTSRGLNGALTLEYQVLLSALGDTALRDSQPHSGPPHTAVKAVWRWAACTPHDLVTRSRRCRLNSSITPSGDPCNLDKQAPPTIVLKPRVRALRRIFTTAGHGHLIDHPTGDSRRNSDSKSDQLMQATQVAPSSKACRISPRPSLSKRFTVTLHYYQPMIDATPPFPSVIATT